ncbi:MAG: hypothetical protein K6A77_03295 [Clostridiales bacterium]|nr:hypothetical protein [Clostridiales bacterium]
MNQQKLWIRGALIISFAFIILLTLFLSQIEYTNYKARYWDLDMDEVSNWFETNRIIGISIGDEIDHIQLSNIPYVMETENIQELSFSHGITYVVYSNGNPVCIRYRDGIGHLLIKANKGKVVGIYVIFASSPDQQDIRMDYDGNQNELDLIYKNLSKDINRVLINKELHQYTLSPSEQFIACGWMPSSENDNQILVIRSQGKDKNDDGMTILAMEMLERK